MHPLYQNADDILQAAGMLVRAYGAQGLQLYPHAAASHICFRTISRAEQEDLFTHAKELGTPHQSGTADEPRFWVALHNPISAGMPSGQKFRWLEITGAKIDDASGKYYPTGPQMLVYVDGFQNEPLKTPAAEDPRFVLRCQSRTPEEQLGLP